MGGAKSIPLSQFEGACLASKGKGNIVVMKGQQPPAGFRKGAYWHKTSPGAPSPGQPPSGPQQQSEKSFWDKHGVWILIVAFAVVIGLVLVVFCFCRGKPSKASDPAHLDNIHVQNPGRYAPPIPDRSGMSQEPVVPMRQPPQMGQPVQMQEPVHMGQPVQGEPNAPVLEPVDEL